MENKYYYILGIILAMICTTGIIVNNIKEDITYADTVCTECFSNEVFNLGEDADGNVHCKCCDCKYEFYINENIN